MLYLVLLCIFLCYPRNTFIYEQSGTALVWCLDVFEKQLYLWIIRNCISLVFDRIVDVNDIIISIWKYDVYNTIVGLMF